MTGRLRRLFTKRNLFRAALGGAVLLVLIQFVPYGRDHANPSITAEPNWDSARTRELAAVACFDCHSNETAWPWYSNIAPGSWLVQRDVDEGRATLNFSEFDRPQPEVDELLEVVREGDMPPTSYSLIHPVARLSEAERAILLDALRQMLRDSPPIQGEDGDED